MLAIRKVGRITMIKGYWENRHLILPVPFFCDYLQLEVNRVKTKRLPFENLGTTACDIWLKQRSMHLYSHSHTHRQWNLHSSFLYISLHSSFMSSAPWTITHIKNVLLYWMYCSSKCHASVSVLQNPWSSPTIFLEQLFLRKNSGSNMIFFNYTAGLHISVVWNESNVMFLEHAIVLTCLYWQLLFQSHLQNIVTCQPSVECYLGEERWGDRVKCNVANLRTKFLSSQLHCLCHNDFSN